MDAKWKREFFEKLDEEVAKITEQHTLFDEEDMALQAVFTTVRGGRGVCVFETQLLEAFDGEPAVEIIVTPTFVIEDDDAFGEIIETIININPYTPMGAFGFHYPTGKMYFRHTCFVRNADDAEAEAAWVVSLFQKMAVVMGNIYDALERIATGESTFAEEAENDELPAQE